ncbi:arylsulfatase B-like [Anthonomus grandis grandis]|uniref:arylsulfatase B-like n=1 Tax=Anthonomus grandis grandis TaxID=2921223 RepID=UPI002166A9EA|nr:arylsulfatase B-like [Anthonomus grandis grandis]
MRSVVIVCCFTVILHSVFSDGGNSRPHIILIIADDVGWNDFSFHGSNQIPTPNIDALGYNGVILDRFYTQAICTPSRAALLTGIYPMRYGYQGIPLSCGEERPLRSDIELLPQKLKKLGYKTHLVGKWHLGAARKNETPTERGFDSHFGYWNGFIGYYDYFAYQNMERDWQIKGFWSGLDLHDGLKPIWDYQGKYATDVFTEKSLEIIENHNKSEPLFLYLGHLAGHTGAYGTELGVPNITVTDEKFYYIDDPMRRRYADIVYQLDKSVGKVVAKLRDKSMLENSIVVFLSDNGAQTVGLYQNYGSNYPLKGLKFTLLEGGIRGSAVLFSPLLKNKSYINKHLMHITDLHSTLIYVAGGNPLERQIDGINQWHSISDNTPSLRTEILLNIDDINKFSGIIGNNGRYKYLRGSYNNGEYDGSYGDSGRSKNSPPYNITEVLSSDVNLAIQGLQNSIELTKEKINLLRNKLDISQCNGRTRIKDTSCLDECVFDLWNDPCETENLIKKKPLKKLYLSTKLNKYIKEMVPSLNKKIDLSSNPINCNNTWYPWLDSDGCFTNNSHVLY